MKILVKLFSALALSAFLAGTANATLITQRLLEVAQNGDTADIGSVTIDTAGAVIDSTYGTGTVSSVVTFNFLDTVDIPQSDITFFEAVFDTNDLSAGLEYLVFDVFVSATGWQFDGFYDDFDPASGYYTVYDASGLAFSNGLALGAVTLDTPATVSEPAGIALFGTLLGLIAWRRKKMA